VRIALARALWVATHPRRGYTSLPVGWSRGQIEPEAAIECGSGIENTLAMLENLAAGEAGKFCDWIWAQTPPGIHSFEQAALREDLEFLTSVFQANDEAKAAGGFQSKANASSNGSGSPLPRHLVHAPSMEAPHPR
jgi:hypothetical protein